ncbi:alpha/beta hydrolase [Paenibacillus chartarius]|uniref:Alpha/beta hydrolase n=1 Tax=Paenibacillus chartarius TaxID=747481 RepID=A0ABV6DMR8_9BACL
MSWETYELWPEGAPLTAGTTDEDRPAVTWYPAPGEGIKSVVVVCPGGGYGRRAAHEGHDVALWLNSVGISAAVLRYRVAPYREPAPQLDAARAIRYVRSRAEEWGIDRERVAILGFSAGGHLACVTSNWGDDGDSGAEDPVERFSSRVQAAVLCYPVITMGAFTHAGSKLNLLGEAPSDELVERYSGEKQVHAATPPTFIWFTADDGAVPVENALDYAAALRQAGVPFALHVFESGRHGLGLSKDHEEAKPWTDLCAAWLRKRGFC